MKTGKTLVELAAELERRAAAKADYLVDTKSAKVTVQPAEITASQADAVTLTFGDKTVGINKIAHAQIASALEIPKAYYDKMLASEPELLATNVNRWFEKYPKTQMVRTLDGKARAFLSDRYRPLENEELAQAVLPVLLEKDLAIMSCEVTDTRLFIKAVDKRVERALQDLGGKFGDGKHVIARVASPAITISNSEVGMGALSILAGVYDSFCSNLATFNERSMRKYHVGGKAADLGEDVYAMLSDKTRRLSDAALWASVGDVVRNAFDRARFDGLVDKIEGTTRDVIADPVKIITLTSKRFGLTEGEGRGILRNLIEGGSLTRFGLYNAITRTAQDIEDYDRATEFERLGGGIIDLPASEWRTLAEAA